MRGQILEILDHPNLNVRPENDPGILSDKILIYLSEWGKWNRKINLTSESDARRILEKHIFDSFQYGLAVNPDAAVIDIGSGAGFPGLFLKVLFPGLKLALVESQRKRANFLKNVVRSMGLDSVEVHDSRAEHLPEACYGKFDFAVFRWVGSLADCLEMAGPYLKSGGRVIVRKEPNAGESAGTVAEIGYLSPKEIPVLSHEGIPSKLMIFEKCST